MNTTRVNRKIDQLGRVVIPKQIRDYLNWQINDKVSFELTNGVVTIEKVADNESTAELLAVASTLTDAQAEAALQYVQSLKGGETYAKS